MTLTTYPCIFGGRMRPLAPGRSSADAPRRRSADEPWAQFDRWALGAVWLMSPGRSMNNEPWAQFRPMSPPYSSRQWPVPSICSLTVWHWIGDHTTVVSLTHVVVCFVYIFINQSVELVILIQWFSSKLIQCLSWPRTVVNYKLIYNWDIVASICGFS